MNKIRSIGTCIGIGGGITAFVLCTLASYTPLINFLWLGFMSMIIYFATGVHKDWKMCGKMFCSFLCGLAWGQLSNLIYVYIFPTNHLLASIVDYGILVALLLWVHLALLQKTPFGFVPTVFLGLATSIAFWGRPFPYQGMGLMGDTSILVGLVLLICYMLFGLIFSLMIEYIAGFLAPVLLSKEKE